VLVLPLDPDPASRPASVVEMRTLRSGDTGVTAMKCLLIGSLLMFAAIMLMSSYGVPMWPRVFVTWSLMGAGFLYSQGIWFSHE
jgi:uncharacterized protein (DUF983 family)